MGANRRDRMIMMTLRESRSTYKAHKTWNFFLFSTADFLNIKIEHRVIKANNDHCMLKPLVFPGVQRLSLTTWVYSLFKFCHLSHNMKCSKFSPSFTTNTRGRVHTGSRESWYIFRFAQSQFATFSFDIIYLLTNMILRDYWVDRHQQDEEDRSHYDNSLSSPDARVTPQINTKFFLVVLPHLRKKQIHQCQ